jgi:hypothetical protein
MQTVTASARTAIACVAGMLLSTCRPAPPAVDLDAIASRYIHLTRALARHDPTLIDHWLTDPPQADPGGRQPVATLRLAVDALSDEVETAALVTAGPARARAEWLQGQTRALGLAAQRLMGESLPFDTEARQAFGITPRRADRFRADRAREVLEQALPGAGPLGDRLAAFRKGFEAPTSARAAVLGEALGACREATYAAIPLPDDETIEVRFADALPWDAHARYLGGNRTLIEVNGSQPLDLSRALRLACHEGSAGHHPQHIWVATELVRARGWAERALVPGFGPALLLAEGAADAATDLALPPERRVTIYRDRLARVAGVTGRPADDFERLVRVEDAQAALEPLIADIAREYLDNRINAATATERLQQEVLMAAPEAFVFFIERRRTRILAYTEGRTLALERLGSTGLAGLHALFVPPAP